MGNGLRIDEETFVSMKASEQRRALFTEMKNLSNTKNQIRIQWYWLTALTAGFASFFTWVINWVVGK